MDLKNTLKEVKQVHESVLIFRVPLMASGMKQFE